MYSVFKVLHLRICRYIATSIEPKATSVIGCDFDQLLEFQTVDQIVSELVLEVVPAKDFYDFVGIHPGK